MDGSTPAQEIEVISPAEAKLRQQTGALANGKPAPRVAMVDTQAGVDTPQEAANHPSYWDTPLSDAPKASAAPTANDSPQRPSYWDVDLSKDNTPAPPPAAPAAPAPKPLWRRALDAYTGLQGPIGHEAGLAIQGLGGAMNEAAGAVNTIAAPLVQSVEAWKDLLTGKITSIAQLKGPAPTDWQDSWFRNTVDPTVENAKDFATDESAPFADKAAHAIGATLGYISQAILTGGESEAPVLAGQVKSGLQLAGDVAAQGVKMAQAPAISQAVNVGREAYKSTGDAELSFKLAAITYSGSVEQNMLPLAMPGRLATRMATGGGLQLAGGEANREAFNAVIPDGMSDDQKRRLDTPELAAENQREAAYDNLRQSFSPEQAVLNLVQGAAMGGVAGPRAEPLVNGMPAQAREAPHTVMDHVQIAAAAEAKANGGDLLDQVVAASHANSVVGAHFDAAAYEAHHEIRNQQAAQEAEVQRQHDEMQAREVALNQAQDSAPEAPTLVYAFDAKEKADQAQKDKDFTAAMNQRGDQVIERAENLNAGVEKGGGTEPAPTIADTLSPDQLAAFQSLKERRAAEMALGEPGKSVPELLKEQNPEDDFAALPPKTVSPKTLAERREQASAAAAPGESPAADSAPQAPDVPQASSDWQAPIEETAKGLAAGKTPEEAENATFQTLADRRNAAVAAEAPTPPASAAEVDAAAHEAATSPKSAEPMPSVAQQNAGNFKMGKMEVAGLPISIEHPEGSTRPSGATMRGGHYGYVRGTVAADGQHLDVLVGKNPEADTAFIVDHLGRNGEYEQAKVLMGFSNRLAAMRSYRSLFPDNKLGPVSEVKTSELKDWINNGDTSKPFDQRGVNRLADTRPSQFADSASPADVSHTQDSGVHVAQTAHGKTIATERPNGNLQVKSTETQGGMRGAGEGTARVERLAQEAHKAGGKLESDNRVSAPAQAIYQRLKDRGYDIKENPSRVDPGTGEKVSASELKPVYEVGPKRTQARDTAPATLAERREAAQADATQPRAAAPGERVGRAITKEEATQRLQPLIDKAGGADRLQVHDTPNDPDVPQNIREDMAEFNHPDPRGVYDPNSGAVHVFAGAKGHASVEDIHDTAVHELAHSGVRNFLGDDYSAAMRDIYANIHDHASALRSPIDGVAKTTAKNWIRDYLDQHGMDARNQRHQEIAADEYVAHLAEHDIGDPRQENPSILRRAIDAVRAGLRKLGVVHEWTDNDVRRLLRESNNNTESAHARAGAEAKGPGLRFADSEDRTVERYPADHPAAIANKYGRTMEDQANFGNGYVKSRLDWLKDRASDVKDWVEGKTESNKGLAFITLRNLPDFMNPKLMPSLRQFIRTHDQMEARRNVAINKAADVARDWSGYVTKDKVRGAALGELMHNSTMVGVDPSKPFENRYTDEAKAANPAKQTHEDVRKDAYRAFRDVYQNKLDDKGRAIFQTVRDHYVQQRLDVYNALKARIEESGADGESKKAVIAELRQKFEASRVQAPYFPLQRFGEYWGSAKDENGNTMSFSRFESRSQQQTWMKAMADKGFAIDGGKKMDDKAVASQLDPKFVSKVTEMARDVDPKLADEIWQSYLRDMPDASMRKAFIHRAGRLGYSMNALRAFNSSSSSGAHQIARLEYGHKLQSGLDDIRSDAQNVMSDAAANPADALKQKNAQWAPALASEMGKRLDWINNPKSSAWSSALTKFGFGWYLGFAPATAFRIATQNPMIAFPVLGGAHGYLGAGKELTRASLEWAAAKGSLGDKLRGDERRAFDQATDMGLFSNTNAQMLSQGGAEGFVGPQAWLAHKAGYMFNAAEHLNRMSTYLAGYRLGRTQGLDHDAAVEHAMDMTWASHFDYNNANRPRVLQTDATKVIGLFRQYAFGVAYRLGREARNMADGELSGADRMNATKTLAGLLTMSAAFSGLGGLPMKSLITSTLNSILGDKDNPIDSEAAAHEYLVQQLGQTAADSIMTGPVGALSGASLSGGASYADLFYRSPDHDETAPDTVKDAFAQLLGPLAAIPVNWMDGVQLIRDGHVERGFEHFVPPEAAALMKAHRYATEGVKTLSGRTLVPQSEITDKDIAEQAAGFTPQRVADAFARNNALLNITKELQARRADISNRLAVAYAMQDADGEKRANADVQSFNASNPKFPIGYREIRAAVRSYYENANGAGVKLPRGLESLHDQYGGGPAPDPEAQ